MSRARDLANSADNDISGTLTVDDITLSGNITVGGTVDGRDLATDGAKLDGVEANATADQTGAEIKAAYEGEANTNAYTDAEKTKLTGVEANADVTDVTNVTAAGALMESAVTNLAQVKAFDSSDYATAAQGATADAALPKSGGTMTGSVSFAAGQTFDGRDLSADGSKLDGIESGATADQSAAEIKTAYESNSNTNAYTDAEKTKLSGIETGATADQTKADIDALNIDADTLDGQHGSYYTGYADTAVANLVDSAPGTLDTLNELAAALGDDPNFSTTVTNNIATKLPLAGGTMTGAITFASGQTFDGRDVSADGAKLDGIESGATADQTITAGSGLTGGGTGDVTISHADTSSVSNSDNSGNTFIQDLTFDGYGHVTAVGTGTVSVGNGTLTVQGTGALGGSGTFTANQSANTTISISHDDTSTQSSVNNSGATVIQDVTLDGYGHVTGLGSKTMTLADLGYTGATNANYITNNNQLTNGAGYTTYSANQSLDTTSSPTFSNPNLTSALRMGGTQVLSSGRALTNIASVDAATVAALEAAGVGGGAVAYQSTAPSNPSNGDLWVNTDVNDGYFKIYTFGSWKNIEWVGQGNTYSGGHLYTQASTGSTSTYTFTVPSGVKSISAVCIGQGGSGVNWEQTGGNGAGALAYKNNISVSAGDTFTVTLSSTGSTFYRAGVVNLVAGAASGRSGGSYSGADGGGNGGDGGINNYNQGPYYAGTGSGGAGGYSGPGADGATITSLTGVNGNSGSGGGGGSGGGAYDTGYNQGYAGGSAGGGTCPYGEGTSGAAGSGDTISGSSSNATAGGHGSIDVTVPASSTINTIAFGAGSNGGYAGAGIQSRGTQRGCCRVVWGIGNNQAFPATNVGYRDGNAAGTTVEGYN